MKYAHRNFSKVSPMKIINASPILKMVADLHSRFMLKYIYILYKPKNRPSFGSFP